jgi:hypothetical protein
MSVTNAGAIVYNLSHHAKPRNAVPCSRPNRHDYARPPGQTECLDSRNGARSACCNGGGGKRRKHRVIVSTGAGRGFCAGADMSLLSTVAEKGIDAAQRAQAVRPAGGIGEGIGADFQKKYWYFPKCSCDSIGMSVRRCSTKRSRCRVNLVSLQQRGIYSSRLGSSWIIRASSG